jgi:broad specificity polyphosphatase/5'/3'-nucleotidase SurE
VRTATDAESGAYFWRPVSVDGNPNDNLAANDYKKIAIKTNDYSIGLVDFDPIHGVNVNVMNVDGKRSNAHVRYAREAAIKHEQRVRESERREHKSAWVRSHGVQRKPQSAAEAMRGGPKHRP